MKNVAVMLLLLFAMAIATPNFHGGYSHGNGGYSRGGYSHGRPGYSGYSRRGYSGHRRHGYSGYSRHY
ncbi:hypothetical protein ACJMK2_005830 [Sinanodonta woodiana]|uniref:Foot protein-3 n=1 Tax=Sinanodonta woodiana TaxID=1069815 RepID=A0ABD3VRA6_SINWO